MIKELLLGSAVLFGAVSIINGQECQSDQECTQPTPFCVQSTCVVPENVENPCLCVETSPAPSAKAPMQWKSRADCRSKKGFQCADECQCRVSNNDEDTYWELRDYCNSRQTKGYCIDNKCLENNAYYGDDTNCPCSNSQGTEVICMNRDVCGERDEPIFKHWGKCTDQCYCEIEGCKEGQDCYAEVGWSTKEECWSKGYLCSVEKGIDCTDCDQEGWLEGYLEQMDENSTASDSMGYDSTRSDSMSSDSMGSDSMGSDSMWSDSMGSDSMGSDSMGGDSMGSDSMGSDSMGSDSMGSDSEWDSDSKWDSDSEWTGDSWNSTSGDYTDNAPSTM